MLDDHNDAITRIHDYCSSQPFVRIPPQKRTRQTNASIQLILLVAFQATFADVILMAE